MEKFKKGDLVIYIGNDKECRGKLFEVKLDSSDNDILVNGIRVYVKHSIVAWPFAHNLLKICNIER